MTLTERQRVLGGLFVAVALLTLAVLWSVLETVFFAVTVAYVLYPVRRRLVDRGAPRRVAAAIATLVGFLVVVLLLLPLVLALYVRRDQLLSLIRSIPTEQSITIFEMTHTVDVSDVLAQAQSTVIAVAVGLASAAPVIGLKAFLFVLLVYGLLLRPGNVRRATLRLVPGEYHDVVLALHTRVRDTMYALYVLQAATAFATFVVAYLVFWLLGYDAAFSLAVFSGILQFIPVLGPSVLIALVAVMEVLAGEVTQALIVLSTGLILVGFLPDAVIRTQLASLTTGMPASLYFVGFVGGTLTIGIVGVIAGPLVVAVLVEVVELITSERASVQQTFQESSADIASDDD